MIAASAPINRIDIAFIICFLVHKEAGVDRVKRYPKANRNQDPASCRESSPRIKLIGVNHGCKVTVEAGLQCRKTGPGPREYAIKVAIASKGRTREETA